MLSVRSARHFRRRADALFDLTAALLTVGPTLSPVPLSLAAVHRRGWGSLDAALAQGRVNHTALCDLVTHHPLAGGQPIYAVDVSVWARCDAETSPERGYYYHRGSAVGIPQFFLGDAFRSTRSPEDTA
jgi:hypothetical protein